MLPPALFGFGLAILPFVRALPSLNSALGPVVNLGYAAFAGNTTSPSGTLNGPVTFFGGIPYALPPLGNLRFRAPEQLDEQSVDGGHVSVTDARNWSAPCIQQPAMVGVGSEGVMDYFCHLTNSPPTCCTPPSRLFTSECLEAF